MHGKYWSRTHSSYHEWWCWCAADAVMIMVIMMIMVMMMTLMMILLMMMAGRVLRCYLATTCGRNAWRIEALRSSCVGGFSLSFTEQCPQGTILYDWLYHFRKTSYILSSRVFWVAETPSSLSHHWFLAPVREGGEWVLFGGGGVWRPVL